MCPLNLGCLLEVITCIYCCITLFLLLREPLGTVGRFTITPQRHYPLQQPGASSVGVLPPVNWDGFRKKNVLSPRNSPAVLSPVTVKIARPDHHNTPRSLHSHRLSLPSCPFSSVFIMYRNKWHTLYKNMQLVIFIFFAFFLWLL